MNHPLHFFQSIAAMPLLLASSTSAMAQTKPIAVAAETFGSAVIVPFQFQDGHIYIEAMINGLGPFRFAFDSGALNVLTPSAAKRLGLSTNGKIKASGTGGNQTASKTGVDTITIGSLSMRDQKFYVVDIPAAVSSVQPLDGLVGFEWLSQFRTRIDYIGKTLTFYPKGTVPNVGVTKAVPLDFKGRIALVEASVDGITGRFSIDTGSSGSLILYPAFAAEHNLVERYKAKTEILSAVGVGGPVYALTTRANQLTIGGSNIVRPVTFLPQIKSGAAADKSIAGRFGAGVLRCFTILFDYPNKQIFFEPNGSFGEPDLADRSGLRLEVGANGLKIAHIVKGSPAAVAGLVVDDVIVSLNERAVSATDLETVKTQFKGAIGTRWALGLASGKMVSLELKDLE